MKLKKRPVSFKAEVAEGGMFSGYASVFGVVDSYREVVASGAFSETLRNAEADERKFPILWGHEHGKPIGTWDSLVEDEKGLYGEGTLWLEESSDARLAYRGMRDRSITGLSIGFYPEEDTFDAKEKVRTLTKVDLVEVSVVLNPANPASRTDAIKSALVAGELPAIKEFEGLLREAGFSRTQATAIAGRGYAHLLRSESEGAGERKAAVATLIAAIDGFKLP